MASDTQETDYIAVGYASGQIQSKIYFYFFNL